MISCIEPLAETPQLIHVNYEWTVREAVSAVASLGLLETRGVYAANEGWTRIGGTVGRNRSSGSRICELGRVEEIFRNAHRPRCGGSAHPAIRRTAEDTKFLHAPLAEKHVHECPMLDAERLCRSCPISGSMLSDERPSLLFHDPRAFLPMLRATGHR
jgi:hypothetical protein